MPALSLRTDETADRVVLALQGELDVDGATVLDPEVARIAGEPGARAVVLDLRDLAFMDSSGLRSVVLADETLRRAGRRLALVRGPAPVQRVFQVTRMEERLTFLDDPADAVEGPPA
jgi:anti-sigma B factor antagonist